MDSSALLLGPPGVGKFEFSVEYAVGALRNKGRVIFVAVDMHPVEIRKWIQRYGGDIQRKEGRTFLFVDCYSSTVEDIKEPVPSRESLRVNSLSNIESIGMNISRAVERIGRPVRIVFYTLSTLFLYNAPQAMAKFFQTISSRVRTQFGSILYVLHQGVHEDRTVCLLESLVDGVAQMQFNENLGREWRIHHYRGGHPDPSWIDFDTNKYTLVTKVDEKRLMNRFLDYEYGGSSRGSIEELGAQPIKVIGPRIRE